VLEVELDAEESVLFLSELLESEESDFLPWLGGVSDAPPAFYFLP
jgi:hypothetical protein